MSWGMERSLEKSRTGTRIQDRVRKAFIMTVLLSQRGELEPKRCKEDIQARAARNMIITEPEFNKEAFIRRDS